VSKLPEGWEEVKLDNILEKFQNGYAFSSDSYTDSGVPIISMANISLNGIFQYDYEKAKYWSKVELDNLKQYQVNKGDLLIAMTDVTPDKKLIGRMAIVDIDDTFLLNQRVGLLKLKDSVNSKFLSEYGNFTIWRKYSKNVAALGAQANISTKDIKNGKILLPPLEEQKKIAEILSTVDQKIAFVDNRIEETGLLKKGLMQKLLTEGIGHDSFKDSEIGRIPVEWEVKKLSDICQINMGQSPKSETYNEESIGLPLIQGNADIKNRKTFPRIFTSEPTKKCNIGDIIMTVRAPVGAVAKSNHNACIGRGVCSITSNEKNDFLYHFLIAYEDKWDKLSQGSTFTAVNGNDIKNIRISIPPFEEQKQIAEILSTTDEKLENLKAKKESFEELKKGLMQKLLTGEVRV